MMQFQGYMIEKIDHVSPWHQERRRAERRPLTAPCPAGSSSWRTVPASPFHPIDARGGARGDLPG